MQHPFVVCESDCLTHGDELSQQSRERQLPRRAVARLVEAMNGKAMAVCMSRRICVELYAEIIKVRPAWHSEEDTEGVAKVVMTGASFTPLISTVAVAQLRVPLLRRMA